MWYSQRPVASSMAPKMLRFWFVPGVITSCRSPLTIQVDRSQGRASVASDVAGYPKAAPKLLDVQAPGSAAAGGCWPRPDSAESGRARARTVIQASHALAVVAVDPAANRARVVLEQGGDLGRGETAQGEPDHHQAQSEAPGALRQGQDVELGTALGLAKTWAGRKNGRGLVGLCGRSPRGYFVLACRS